MTPRVSVIMTVRNGARYLPETLDALSRQTFADYELVVNDNGSTDGTLAILADYASRDSRIRVLPPSSRRDPTFTQGIQRAFEAATAPLVAVNDSDDVPEPTRLEKLVVRLDADPRVAIATSWFDNIDEAGCHLASHRLPMALADAYQTGNPVAHSSIMYRRVLAVSVGGYREKFTFASDFALQVAMMSAGGGVAIVPEPLIKIRLHAQQASLMPGKRPQYYWEPLDILRAASRLPGVSWRARLRGMVARQKLALRYGWALWCEGRRTAGVAGVIYWLFVSLTSLWAGPAAYRSGGMA
ncbi:MAG: glycosyltransferase [Rhodopseudomonas sp.]|nr:glycosyltransferase [Rhodopseudomonas sp.]